MENMKSEIRNRRILFLIAVLVIGFAYYVSGQTFYAQERAASYRDEPSVNYDTTKYFSFGIYTRLKGKVVKTDSIEVLIYEDDGKTAVGFDCAEKSIIFLLYNKTYNIEITKRGYSTSKMKVYTSSKPYQLKNYFEINLVKNNTINDYGSISYDNNIKELHRYYKE